METITILIIVAVVVLFWIIATYNRLITLRNRTKEAASDIEVQLKLRFDLIPNLVETVKGYMTHEAGVLEKVTLARSAGINAKNTAEGLAADNQLVGALKSLFAVAEAYPDLKANSNFAKLQDELSDTENKIQAARRFYNSNVRDFNTKIEHFPSNLIAGAFGFKAQEFFDAPDEVNTAPQVKF